MNEHDRFHSALLARVQLGLMTSIAIGLAAYHLVVEGSNAVGWVVVGWYAAAVIFRILATVERWTDPDIDDRPFVLVIASLPILVGAFINQSATLLAVSVAYVGASAIGFVVRLVNSLDNSHFAGRPPDGP